MKIISISKEKQHLSKITLDSGDELLLDNDIVSLYCLHEEDNISKEKCESLSLESDISRAKSRAFWYLDRGALTEKALYDKLKKAKFSERAIAAVIARLIELKMLDDRRYAQNFAERCESSNISKRETVFKLINKGVPVDLAKEVVEDLQGSEEEKIKNLIEKKYKDKLTDKKTKEKVFAALIRKGFSYGAVREVMKKYIEELDYYE